MEEIQPQIVIVNRFAPPDISATSQILGSLVSSLAPFYEVHVVTSRSRYDDPAAQLPAGDKLGSVRIHRVWTTRFGRATIPGRLSDYFTFYISAPIKAFRVAKPGAIIIAMTDPPMISVPLALVSQLRGAHLVNWLQDVFPEVAIKLGMRLGGEGFSGLLKRIRNFSLRRAKVNVVLGHRMEAIIKVNAPRNLTVVIPNWSPSERIAPLAREQNPLATEWGIEHEFIIGYSGNLGRAHDLFILIEAAQLLRHRDEIRILIIGDGVQKSQLVEEVRKKNLTNVWFKPYQLLENLEFSLTLPDIHLVSLKPELEGLVVPSKFYSSVAAGKPIIFIGAQDGELARWVECATPCGIIVRPDDAEGLASAISYLCDNNAHRVKMGSNARTIYANEFSTPVALNKWRETIQKIVCGS